MNFPAAEQPGINPRPPLADLTLFRCYGLKRSNLLFHPNAFTLWASDFFLFVFGNCHH
jgi:hypothetical protein